MSALGGDLVRACQTRCATPSAVVLGVDSLAPSPQTLVVKVITLWRRSLQEPLRLSAGFSWARALTSSQPHLLFGVGTYITRAGSHAGSCGLLAYPAFVLSGSSDRLRVGCVGQSPAPSDGAQAQAEAENRTHDRHWRGRNMQ